jgi:hypothetical protein
MHLYSLSDISHMKPPIPPAIEGNIYGIVPTPAYELHMYRTMAGGRLYDTMETPIFVCGMDTTNPCYDVFHCDPSLDCTAHIEADLHTSKI